jgi:hypothetical protein
MMRVWRFGIPRGYGNGKMRRIVFTIALVIAAPIANRASSLQGVVPFSISDDPARFPWATASVPVVFQFSNDVAGDLVITRLVRTGYEPAWHLADTIRVAASGGRAAVTGPIGIETLLVVRAGDQPGYLLDGPFRWPSKPSTYVVRTEWRKTIRGMFAGQRASLQWVSPDADPGPGAACEWRAKAEWECVGVPLRARGVIVMISTGQVTCGIPSGVVSSSGVDTATTRTSAWGRMIIVQRPPGATGRVRITATRLEAADAASRLPLDGAFDSPAHVEMVADDVAWVAGAEVRDDWWLEIEAMDWATERVAVREVAAGPADRPLRLQVVRLPLGI